MKRQMTYLISTILVAAILVTPVVFAAPAAPAQLPGELDTTFDPGTGANEIVFSVAPQSDGKVLIGGQFTRVNGVPHFGIARLDPVGALDPSFTTVITGTGFSGLTSIALQADGKIVIGGAFSQVNGTNRANIARLESSGALDLTFEPGTGVSGGPFPYLNVVLMQPDGKVLIGGSFSAYHSLLCNNITRVDIHGELDPTFDPGSGANDEVAAIALQPSDGKVLIGGIFTKANGYDHIGLARLFSNGSVDNSFNPSIDNGAVLAIAVQPDNKILIGGSFTSVNNTPRNHLARLNANGTLDTSYDPNAGNEVDGITLQPDGKSLIGGRFLTVGGVDRIRIARLNLNGSLDTAFDPGLGAAAGIPTVYAMPLEPGGKILVGGGFQTMGGVERNRIARLWGDRFLFLPMIRR